MANSLVKTTFVAGPDDKMAAVDVYGEAGNPGATNRIQPYNTESSQLLNGGFGSNQAGSTNPLDSAKLMSSNALGGAQNAITQALRNITQLAAQSTSLISGTIDQIRVNKEELTNRILNASSEFSSAMRELTPSVNNQIMNSIPLRSDVMVAVDGIKSKISSADLRSVQAIGRVINDVTKTNLFSSQDTGALSGILGSVVGSASSLGIPNAFQTITSTITDNKLITALTRVAVPQVLSSSNMQELLSISRTPTGKVVEAIAPGTVSKISKLYKAPTNIPRNSRDGYSIESILEILTNFKPDWDTYKRNPNDSVINVLVLMGGSNDFKTLLKDGVYGLSDDKKAYMFASLVKQTSVADSIKKDFPMICTTSLGKTRKITTDVMHPNLGK